MPATPRPSAICAAALLLTVTVSQVSAQNPAADKPEPNQPAADTPAASKPVLDPRGRLEDSPKNQPARFYVWHDKDDWHIRSASKTGNAFKGTIRVTGGTFKKFRPVGLDVKAKNPDRWTLSEDRTELTFAVTTRQGFDGFDWSIDGPAATLEFDLLVANQKAPKKIFIGRGGDHPAQATFTLPAVPKAPVAQ